jgi:hypothetical protein
MKKKETTRRTSGFGKFWGMPFAICSSRSFLENFAIKAS